MLSQHCTYIEMKVRGDNNELESSSVSVSGAGDCRILVVF